MQTLVKVRVQASGGKYLGDAVSATPPLLTVSWPGPQPPIGPIVMPTAGSGLILAAAYQPSNASPYPIVVEQTTVPNDYNPGTYYLLPTPSGPDSYLIVSLDLPAGEPTPVTFSVQAFSTAAVAASTTAGVTGGQDQTDDPGVVVLVPGLRVTDPAATTDGSGVTITANVNMMCGCQIAANDASPKEPFWPAYEFGVAAQVQGYPDLVTLNLNGPSMFKGYLAEPVPVGTVVAVIATQPSTQNITQMETVVVDAS